MKDELEMRKVFNDTLIELSKTNDKIVVIESDLQSCHLTNKFFGKEYPDRVINVGIAEANMIGVAAGMSTMGKIPFALSFGPFATRRCFDQIFISVAYAKQNVKIVGSDPGVTAEANGGTHMPFEDMAIMRSVPTMICFEPTDAAQFKAALPQIVDHYGPVYIRMFRKQAEQVFCDECMKDFKLGKASKVKDGKDVTIFASGIMVSRAVEAAELLKAEGIDAAVSNMHTWKPIDEEAIEEAAKKTGAIVTAENHNVIGGLYSAVAEVVAKKCLVPVEAVGVNDEFGQVGKNAYLSEVYHLTTADIVAAAKKAVARK